jgi:hypothetical protein
VGNHSSLQKFALPRREKLFTAAKTHYKPRIMKNKYKKYTLHFWVMTIYDQKIIFPRGVVEIFAEDIHSPGFQWEF